jgi:hypothetical protein
MKIPVKKNKRDEKLQRFLFDSVEPEHASWEMDGVKKRKIERQLKRKRDWALKHLGSLGD